MKHFAVVELRMDSPDWIGEYNRVVEPLVEKHGGKYVCRTNKMERIEGERDLPSVYVILEWPSKEAFENFYNDPDYQESLKLRKENSRDEFILAPAEDIAKQ